MAQEFKDSGSFKFETTTPFKFEGVTVSSDEWWEEDWALILYPAVMGIYPLDLTEITLGGLSKQIGGISQVFHAAVEQIGGVGEVYLG